MAIIFLQQKKFQKILLVVFILIIIITLIIIWQGVFRKQTVPVVGETSLIPKKEINIDFDKLISQDLQSLIVFPDIDPFQEIPASETEEGEKIPGVTIGRDNPFLPY